MISVTSAVLYTFVIGAVIFFCRFSPFVFFREESPEHEESPETPEDSAAPELSEPRQTLRQRFLSLAEKTVPPLAMTVLAFNAMAGPVKENPSEALPVLAAAALTALVHLWKRNALASIFSGTALYMILERFLPS
jgi:branched-subunit amino acid transport protein AzlD